MSWVGTGIAVGSIGGALISSSGGSEGGMSSSDVNSQIQLQAQADIDTATANMLLNNPSYTTPWGTQTLNEIGNAYDVPLYEIEQTLDPADQALLDQSRALQQQQGDIISELYQEFYDTLGTPFGADIGEARQQVEDALFGQAMSQLTPQFEREQAQLTSKLSNQGIQLGSDAYADAWSILNEGQNNLTNQALWNAIDAGAKEESRLFAEESYLRNLPLYDLAAIGTGTAPPSPPVFSGYSGGTNIQAPDYMAALGMEQNINAMNQAAAAREANAWGNIIEQGVNAFGNWYDNTPATTPAASPGAFTYDSDWFGTLGGY